MGWEDAGEPLAAPLPVLDPFEFTAAGRRFEALERELGLAEAVLNVGRLVLAKRGRETELKSARKRHRQR
jgi:hypothetical protein